MKRIFKKNSNQILTGIFILIVFSETLLTASSFPWNYSVNNNKGVSSYQSHEYKEAQSYFEKALNDMPENLTIKYNLSDSFYQQKRYAEAQTNYLEILKNEHLDPELREKIYYNLGNTLYRLGEESKHEKFWESSLNYYEKAIGINPEDINAKENYEFVKKQLELLKKKEKEQNNNKDKQNQDQNNSENKQNQQNQNTPSNSTPQNNFDYKDDDYTVTNSELDNAIKEQQREENFMQNYIDRRSADSKNKVYQYMKKDW